MTKHGFAVFTRMVGAGFSLFAFTALADSSWNVDADGDWHTAANWNNGVPQGENVKATLGGAIAANRVITLTQNVSQIGTVEFNDDNNYLITGGFTINLDTSGSWGYVTGAGGGAHSIASSLDLKWVNLQVGNASAGDLTISGVIQATAAGFGAVEKVGAGVLVLSGPNTYSGKTTLTAGKLKLGAAGVIPDSSDVDGSAGVLDLNGFNESINRLGGSAGVTNNSATAATLTIGAGNGTGWNHTGLIRGNVSVAKAGTGTQQFSSAHAFSGSVTVNAGTLDVRTSVQTVGGGWIVNGGVLLNGGGRLDGSGVTVNSGGTCRIPTGGGDSIGNARPVVVNDGGMFDFQQALVETVSALSLSGAGIGGVGALVNSANTAALLTPTGGTTLTGPATIGVTQGTASLTLNNAIGGAFGLTKVGAGTLALGTRATYTGGTTVTGGTLNLTGGGGSAGTIRGTVTVGSGATLQLSAQDVTGYGTGTDRLSVINVNGGTLRVNTTLNQTMNAAITLAGATVSGVAGSNIDLYNNGASVSTLAAAATSTISVPTMNLRQNDTPFTVADGVATPDLLVSSILGNGNVGNHNLVKNGPGTLLLSANNTYTGTTRINDGTLQIGNGGITGTLGSGAVTDNGMLTFKRSDNIAYGQAITGTGGLTQAGAGALTLSAQNAYSGGTTVNAGILRLNQGPSNIGTIRGALTVNAGALAESLVKDSVGYDGTGNLSVLNLNGGTFSHTPNQNLTLGACTINLAGGTLQTTDPAGYFDFLDNIAVQALASAAPSTIAGRINLRAGQPLTVFTVADGGAVTDLVVNATITEESVGKALTKSGAGAMALNAATSYSGATTVNGGTLLVNAVHGGGATATYAVTGAVLGGSGSLPGPVTVGGDGVLAPGAAGTNGVGTLTVNGAVDLQAASTLHINLRPAGCDQLLMTGAYTLGLAGSALEVVLPAGYVPDPDTAFTIVSGFSVRTGTFMDLPDGQEFLSGGSAFIIRYDPHAIVLAARKIDNGTVFVVR